jgi:ATP adenylyltransferase
VTPDEARGPSAVDPSNPPAGPGASVDVDPAAGAPAGATGVPDAFTRLWTPHRMAYIAGENKPTGPGPGDNCPFCRAPAGSDEDGLVVARGRTAFVLLNLYPYTSGHLMVCPYRHVSGYDDLTRDECAEIAVLTQRAIGALREVYHPQGFNVGMNLGAVAGAGVAAHLHQHVVPRWGGDTNFMPVVARTRVLPQSLPDGRARLSAAWPTDHA